MDKSKREFCKKYFLQQAVNIAAGFKDGVRAAKEKEDFESFFDSYESSYALTLAYPDEILLDTARKFGVETEGREKKDIIKELFKKKQDGREYRF
jgi:hypothetical protein